MTTNPNVAYKPLSSTVDVLDFSDDDEEDDIPLSLTEGTGRLQLRPISPVRNQATGKPFSKYCIGAALCLPATCFVIFIISIVSVSKHGTTTGAYDPDWWKTHIVYQVYPRSFQDSNGDGTGDINGIIQRLDYLRDTGVRAIWLSPMYPSPMKDFGYDISNYRNIDPLFGTMSDFKNLVRRMHDLKKEYMYLIMDLVPNHTSDQHPWFKKSLDPVNNTEYEDYYVWLSRFGNSSWEWNDQRKQYYLHKFLISQPDLNYRNPKVRRAMIDVMRFWLDLGVDGFRIDAITHLVENNGTNHDWHDNEKVTTDPSHSLTVNQPETFEVAREWADFFAKYGHEHDKHIFTVAEMTDMATAAEDMRWYDTRLDLPFNFELSHIDGDSTAADIRGYIKNWMDVMPDGKWPNWVVGNHDQKRVASRLGKGADYIDIINMLLLMLPGTPTCYYGDEIGMTNVFVPFNETKDPAGKKWGPDAYQNYSRDGERSPMQWDATVNAGFSSAGKTWLPIQPNYTTVNVDQQMKISSCSHWSVFKQLVQWKQTDATLSHLGKNLNLLDDVAQLPEPIFGLVRSATALNNDNNNWLLLFNIGAADQSIEVDVSKLKTGKTGVFSQVVLTSCNLKTVKIGNSVTKVNLAGGQGLILRNENGVVE